MWWWLIQYIRNLHPDTYSLECSNRRLRNQDSSCSLQRYRSLRLVLRMSRPRGNSLRAHFQYLARLCRSHLKRSKHQTGRSKHSWSCRLDTGSRAGICCGRRCGQCSDETRHGCEVALVEAICVLLKHCRCLRSTCWTWRTG